MNTRQLIFEKIKESPRIVIMRHIRPDGDACGASLGLRALLRASFPDKDIRVLNEDATDRFLFLGEEDDPQDDEFYRGALGIAVDTAGLDRLSNSRAGLCRTLIKLDHHINIAPYGDLSLVEDSRSSACELLVSFYEDFRDELVLTPEAARCLFTGMVTDSLRFKTSETSGETLRMAALLLDAGIDTEAVFAHLYLDEPEELAYKAWALQNLRYTENGVVYLHITEEVQKALSLSNEQASAAVGFMDSIKGSLIWLAFIDYPDGSTRVRLRSRFTTVDKLANRYHGGGHAQASGATVYSREEALSLLRDADAALKEYKETHEGWL